MSDLIPFEDVQRLVDEFKQILADRGLAVKRGSQLDVACDATAEILLKHWDPRAER